MFGDEDNVLASIEAGALGYIHKDATPDDIAQTISLLVTPNTLDFLTLTKGNSQLTGQYTEVITLTGLNGAMRTFNTAGTFSLNRISTVSTLTTQ